MALKEYSAALLNRIEARTILFGILILFFILSLPLIYIDSPALGELENISYAVGQEYALNYLIPARAFVLTLSVLTLSLLYFWSNKILGNWWSLVPIVLTAFNPSFIGVSHLFRPEALVYATVIILAYLLTDTGSNLRSLVRRRSYFQMVAAFIFITGSLVWLNSLDIFQLNQGKLLASLFYFADQELYPTLILILFSALLAMINIFKKIKSARQALEGYLVLKPYEFLTSTLTLVLLIFFIGSDRAEYLPALSPLVYILASSALKNYAKESEKKYRARITMVLVFITLAPVRAAFIHPDFLSYRNNLIETSAELEYYSASKTDFGTDLEKLSGWLSTETAPEAKIGLDYFGGVDPLEYLGSKYVPWRSVYTAPIEIKLDYLGISAKRIYEAKRALAAGELRNPEDEYLWLPGIDRPDLKIGSIWIYKITEPPADSAPESR